MNTQRMSCCCYWLFATSSDRLTTAADEWLMCSLITVMFRGRWSSLRDFAVIRLILWVYFVTCLSNNSSQAYWNTTILCFLQKICLSSPLFLLFYEPYQHNGSNQPILVNIIFSFLLKLSQFFCKTIAFSSDLCSKLLTDFFVGKIKQSM